MNEFELLKEKSADFNIMLNNEQVEKFKDYLYLLKEFNSHTNLVSSAITENVVIKHFLDSLALGLTNNYIDFNRELKVIDIGIGGGFPGIPLLIAFHDWKLCAVDSINKKLEFIKVLSDKLSLTDRVEIICSRAEELGQDYHRRESYDLAITRAVSKMNIISEYCLPLVVKNGYFIAYKGKSAEEETIESQKALSILGGNVEKIISYSLTGEEQRSLIVIKKTGATPEKYPRRTGVPLKKPL